MRYYESHVILVGNVPRSGIGLVSLRVHECERTKIPLLIIGVSCREYHEYKATLDNDIGSIARSGIGVLCFFRDSFHANVPLNKDQSTLRLNRAEVFSSLTCRMNNSGNTFRFFQLLRVKNRFETYIIICDTFSHVSRSINLWPILLKFLCNCSSSFRESILARWEKDIETQNTRQIWYRCQSSYLV